MSSWNMNTIDPARLKRILITRLDRLGDVILSSPVFSAVKQRFPSSHVTVLVLKETEAVVRGNPWVNQVLVYDKRGSHQGWLETIRFARRLKAEKFDVAVHLHPTNRAHVISYFARIPIRIGYRRKNHYLLTHAIEEKKWQGAKHEAEYNFDLLRSIDVKAPSVFKLHMPLRTVSEGPLRNLLPSENQGRYAVFHPSASSSSKMWSPERFGSLADFVARTHRLLPVIIGEGEGITDARKMEQSMRERRLNLAGKLNLEMLGWLLKGARILVSNDSGPVHMAAALGTPVISIFGRNQGGLGAIRWKPISERSSYLQKEVGCIQCLADRCKLAFKCLNELRVEDVIEEVKKYESFFA